MQRFKVIRAHDGDRQYRVGDVREANEADVMHLIGKCLVKAREKPANKSRGKSPSNKASR